MTTYTFRHRRRARRGPLARLCPRLEALEAQGASTWAYTREEALANIREVLVMIVV